MTRASRARRVRAADDALTRAWEASLGWERQKGRRVAGRVKVMRKDGPGSGVWSGVGSHGRAFWG
jgi:hypothetical protein